MTSKLAGCKIFRALRWARTATFILVLASVGTPAKVEALSAGISSLPDDKAMSIQPATSEFVYPASDFLEICEAEESGRTGSRRPCSAYIAGVFAAMATTANSQNEGKSDACLPAEAVPGERLREIFIDYVHRHPKTLDEHRLDVVQDAFAEAFPCS